jgi:endonuclease III
MSQKSLRQSRRLRRPVGSIRFPGDAKLRYPCTNAPVGRKLPEMIPGWAVPVKPRCYNRRMDSSTTATFSAMATWTPTQAIELLRRRYGQPVRFNQRPPVDELISTILSQHTSDINTERAYLSLKRRFPNWQQVIDAPTGQVAEAIRGGGLARQKAPRIQQALREIQERTGGFDLDFLANVPVDEARDWLTAIAGVGPKTASCVLLFSLHRPALPVDTHVHRVALRLGFVPPRTTAERAQTQLEARIAPEDRYDAHLLLIKHGRETCVARSPHCGGCVLAVKCPTAPDYLEAPSSTHTPNGTA